MEFACYVRALERRGGAFAGESAYLNDIPAIRAEGERLGMQYIRHREKNRWAAVMLRMK